jgi:hypothetical protein
MADFEPEKFYTVSVPGTGGLHTIVDPQDIDDTEMADCRNVIFTGGYVQPRQGCSKLFSKPNGETNTPNILSRATTSDGVDYLITVYGSNFYLWDSVNSQQILLNTGSSYIYKSPPGVSGYQKFWSYETWLGGIGTDVMYFVNGVDTTTKWQMSLGYTSLAAVASDIQLIFPYPQRFDTSVQGTLLAMLGGTPTAISASSTSNVLSIVPNPSVTTFVLASSNSANTVPTIVSGTYGYVLNVQPTNGDTFTMTINGTPCVVNWVDTIGATPGNVLKGSTPTDSMLNLYNFLISPGTTNSKQVAFGSTQLNLVIQCAYSTFNYNAVYFPGGVGQIVPAGTAVTSQIGTTFNVPICSIIKSLQTRLWAVGGIGTENKIAWSQTIVPENFTVTSTVNTDPGTTVWGQGRGGINAIVNGNGSLWFFKQDLLAQGQFIYSQDATTSYIFSLVEFAAGSDTGVSNFKRILNNQNTMYYITESSGVAGLSNAQELTLGTTVSSSSSVTFKSLSDKIDDRLQDPNAIYYFDWTTSFFFGNKGFWAVSPTENAPNSLLLMYDFDFSYWTVFDGWFVQDMIDWEDDMYFLSNADGAVYMMQDSTSDNGFAFKSFWSTKRFDFGDPAMPKTIDKVFIQGYIDNITTLQVDVLYNENGFMWKQTFHLNGNSVFVLKGNQSGVIGSETIGEFFIGGSGTPATGTLVPFRCYLDCSSAYWFHNVQLVFSSNQIGAAWKVDKFGFNAIQENSYPPSLILAQG